MKLNPVFKNEVKLGSRTMKSSWLVFGYNLILIIVSMSVLYGMIEPAHYGYSVDFSEMVSLYVVMTYLEFAMILLIIPAITAGSIAGERERQTLDMLLATKMKPHSIVLGKLESSLSSVLMLAVSSLPVLSIVFIYGGVGILELIKFVIILCVSAVFIGSIGIFFSAWARRVTTATILSYLTLILFLVGTFAIEKGIYSMAEMKVMALSGDVQATVGNMIFLLLLNPAVTFYGLISAQVGSSYAVAELCASFGVTAEGGIFEWWVPLSMALQLLFSIVFLYLAGRRINPLK